MAFNTAVQKLLKLAGLYLEAGSLSFTTGETTVEVPTKCRTRIWCAFGVMTGTNGGGGVWTDKAVTAGCVTFTRASDAGTDTFDYILFGY